MRRLRVLPSAGFFALCLGILPGAAPAQTANFTVAENGHTVGTASFRFNATPRGYDSGSLVRVAMQGLDYALSKDERLNAANRLEHAQLNATVNGEAVNVIAAFDSAQFLLNISANGKSTTTRLAAHGGAVLLPDFDPGALETLLALAAARNDRNLWVILPKAAGSIEPVKLATYPDQKGTLDGRPITVHHLMATIAGANTQLFSGPRNQLLQAELPQPGFALVRKGFILSPPAKPIVPMSTPQGAPPAPAP